LLGALTSIGALAVLWAFRPSFAALPRSLDEPLTATALQEVGLMLAWLAVASIALSVLARAMRAVHRRPPVAAAPDVRRSRPSAPRSRGLHPTRSQVRSRSSRPSALTEQVVLTLNAPVETEPDVEQQPRILRTERAAFPRMLLIAHEDVLVFCKLARDEKA